MAETNVTYFLVKLIAVTCLLSPTSPSPYYSPQSKSLAWRGSDVLDDVPLIDGHNDLPYNLYNIELNMLADFDFDSDLRQNAKWQVRSSFTDLPRLREGKLGGQFWVAYVSCSRNFKDAVERTIEQIDVIKRLIGKYPRDLMYVTEADQIMEAKRQGKIASMIEIEGGHSLDSRLSSLRLFYELGVRCMTITHNCNLPWADENNVDNNPDMPKRNLTAWGRNVIFEMNRLGMIADISHVSEGVMVDVLETSRAPVMFSHSSVYSLRPHSRNVKDHVLRRLKDNGGIIMINFYSAFIRNVSSEATIYDVVDHINYVRNLIGADHVGIGSDYDGVTSMPQGLEDVSKYPAIFDILAEGGVNFAPWSELELKKLAGLNLMRVFKEVEAVRDSMRNEEPIDDPIPYEDVVAVNEGAGVCRTDLDKYFPKNLRLLGDFAPAELA